MVNNKIFEHRPMNELMSIVRQDFRKWDDEGMIDDGTLIKTVMYCNDRLGIGIREVKQVCIPVIEHRAKLPLDFEKLYFAAALNATNGIVHSQTNPFDNNFDRDIIYEADVDRDSLGCADNYNVIIKRESNVTIHSTASWITLSVDKSSDFCHNSCPNMRKPGKHQISIDGDSITTPFKNGELYIMYIATMCDEEGNLLFPFHPMITPYYEWSIKEKIIMDAIFNSDITDANLLALAQREKTKAWLDAYDMTTSKGFGEYVKQQRRKEMGWYNEWFKFFQ